MTWAAFARAQGVNPLRHAVLRRALLPRAPRAPAAAREVAARRTLDRLLAVATLASLGAALEERRARSASPTTPIPSFPVDLAVDPPERLRLLPGLGPTRLAALLRERDLRGAPAAWSDVERVRGIGVKTVASWRASGARLGTSAPPGRDPSTPPNGGQPLDRTR